MNRMTATDARSNFFTLIKKTIRGHVPIHISSKEGTAILISEEDYESLIETAELLSEPGFKRLLKKADREIKRGEIYSFEEVFKE